jgi:hypothetical protein
MDNIDEKKVEAMETGRHESLSGVRRNSTTNKFSHRLSVAGAEDVDAQEGQLYSMGETDPALDAKMRLLNSVSPMRNAQRNKVTSN